MIAIVKIIFSFIICQRVNVISNYTLTTFNSIHIISPRRFRKENYRTVRFDDIFNRFDEDDERDDRDIRTESP